MGTVERKNKLNGIGITILVVTTVCVIGYWQGLTTFVFAWVLNFLLMLWTAYLIQSLPADLNWKYYLPKSWERNGGIYRMLGVNLYRKLLVLIGWERLQRKDNPVNTKLETLRSLEQNTRRSELGHLIIFLIVLLVSCYVAANQGFEKAKWLLILNILLNAYPIMVQRYNRPRLLRLIRNTEIHPDFNDSTRERG